MNEETRTTEYPQIDLDGFIAWVQQKPGRTVKIKINDCEDTRFNRFNRQPPPVTITLWAYDYDLNTGQRLVGTKFSADQLNLETLYEQEKEKKAEELRKQIAESQRQLERLEADKKTAI